MYKYVLQQKKNCVGKMFLLLGNFLSIIFTVYAANRQPARASYLDKISSVCLPKWASLSMLDVTRHNVACIRQQRLYLQCIPYRKPFFSYFLKSSRYTKPCGFIRSHQHYRSRVRHWDISVVQGSYLNLTFHRFSLPMGHGLCKQRQGSEFVFVHQTNKFHQTSATEVYLCGKRSPFSLLLNSSSAGITHSTEMRFKFDNVGFFVMNYQLYDAGDAAVDAVINHYRVTDNMGILHIRQLFLYQVVNDSKEISLHIVGDRFQILHLSVNGTQRLLNYLNIAAYDGPSPSQKHQVFPSTKNGSDILQIKFATFQAYLKLVCNKWQCRRLKLHYIFRSTLIDVKPYLTYTEVAFQQQQIVSIDLPHQAVCMTGALLYCLFEINLESKLAGTKTFAGSHIYDKVNITFEKIVFPGPDYIGNYPEENMCLLAGISVVDAYRLEIMQGFSMSESNPVKRDVIDSVLPEVTMCYTIPQEKTGEPGKFVRDLPMKVFLSMSQTVYILIYAYGAFIDLNKYLFSLTASITNCLGVMIDCPISTTDSLLTLSRDKKLFTTKRQIPGKEEVCPFGHLSLIDITYDQSEHYKSHLYIHYCTDIRKYHTHAVMKHVTNFGAHSEKCLFVQSNPSPALSDRFCDATISGFNMFSVKFSLFQSLKCTFAAKTESLFLLHGDTQGLLLNTPPSQRVFNGTMLAVMYRSNCLHYSVKVTSQCLAPEKSAVNLSAQWEDAIVFNDEVRPICNQYTLQVDTTQMHKIDVRKHILMFALEFDSVLEEIGTIFNFLSHIINEFLGFYALVMRLSLFGNCSRSCSRYEISVVYEESSERALVLLQWKAHLQTSRDFEIVLPQIPLRGWLIYIQHLCFTNSVQDNCYVVVLLSDTNQIGTENLQDALLPNLTSFATYHFLWTKEEYTWLDAESLCAGLGMHLVSITSDSEQLIVTDMLAGAGFYGGLGSLLTPCRLETPLCIIYIGLQVEVKCKTINNR